jgi:hypothetical protein
MPHPSFHINTSFIGLASSSKCMLHITLIDASNSCQEINTLNPDNNQKANYCFKKVRICILCF